jgi:predicted nucleic acid-binding protein
LPLAWSLRERIALKDALYVALARTLDASLLTTDQRLARAVEGIVPLA